MTPARIPPHPPLPKKTHHLMYELDLFRWLLIRYARARIVVGVRAIFFPPIFIYLRGRYLHSIFDDFWREVAEMLHIIN